MLREGQPLRTTSAVTNTMVEPLTIQLPTPHVIGGVQVHPIRLNELLAWIPQVIAARQHATVMYLNAYAVNLAQQDSEFQEAINRASLVFCDGNGVRLAAGLLGAPLPERFTPPDWIPQLAAMSDRRAFRLFFLGAQPGVAALAAERLQRQFPTLEIAAHHGYFDRHGAENEEVVRRINEAAPHILLVGMGMPRQELWIQENGARLSAPVTISVGALFDYLAGEMPRGPRWLTDNGFEWLCRLWFEPRRLWRRYLLGNPAFIWLVLRQFLREREARKSIRADG